MMMTTTTTATVTTILNDHLVINQVEQFVVKLTTIFIWNFYMCLTFIIFESSHDAEQSFVRGTHMWSINIIMLRLILSSSA